MKFFKSPWLLLLGALAIGVAFSATIINKLRSNGAGKVADLLTPKNQVNG